MKNISRLKKIELHRHMEGCIDPTFFTDHLLNSFPDDRLLKNSKIEELFQYTDFLSFLTSWSIVMKYLTDYNHFRDLARHVIQQLKKENIGYDELIFSPQPFINSGLDVKQLFDVMYEEFKSADIPTHIIIDFVRNFGNKAMSKDLEPIIEVKKNNEELSHWIRAVSIGGDEVNFPANLFLNSFKRAKEAGFHIYAHDL